MAGVIHNPAAGEMYTARRGGGAHRNGEPVRVSDVGALDRRHADPRRPQHPPPRADWDGFLRLVDATDRQRGFGDYLGYGLVAEGKAELYAEAGLKPWDLAPCKIIVEEAGGRFTDFDGRPTIYTGTAFASNGRLHEVALRLLAGPSCAPCARPDRRRAGRGARWDSDADRALPRAAGVSAVRRAGGGPAV